MQKDRGFGSSTSEHPHGVELAMASVTMEDGDRYHGSPSRRDTVNLQLNES